jgi:hypothetical protein
VLRVPLLIEEVTLWIAPPADRRWVKAMISERHYLPKGSASSIWLLACFKVALQFRLRDRWSQFGGATTVFAALTIVLDWDVNSTVVSVGLICASSFMLALLWPVRTVTAVTFGGAALSTAHAIADFWRPLWPSYQYKQLDGSDWFTLIAALLPSIVFAAIGVQLRRCLGDSVT